MGSKKQKNELSIMRRVFGFELSDLQSWSNIVKLLNRPEDPSSLAVLRIFFGMNKSSSLIHIHVLFLKSSIFFEEQTNKDMQFCI